MLGYATDASRPRPRRHARRAAHRRPRPLPRRRRRVRDRRAPVALRQAVRAAHRPRRRRGEPRQRPAIDGRRDRRRRRLVVCAPGGAAAAIGGRRRGADRPAADGDRRRPDDVPRAAERQGRLRRAAPTAHAAVGRRRAGRRTSVADVYRDGARARRRRRRRARSCRSAATRSATSSARCASSGSSAASRRTGTCAGRRARRRSSAAAADCRGSTPPSLLRAVGICSSCRRTCSCGTSPAAPTCCSPSPATTSAASTCRSTTRRDRVRRRCRARSAASWRCRSPCLVGVPACSLVGGYGWPTLLLVNNYLGPVTHEDGRWHYWFIEAFVQILVSCSRRCSPSGRCDGFERRFPYLFPLVPARRRARAARAVGRDRRLRQPALPDPRRRVVLRARLARPPLDRRRTASVVDDRAVRPRRCPGSSSDEQRGWFIAVGLVLLVWCRGDPRARGSLIRPVAADRRGEHGDLRQPLPRLPAARPQPADGMGVRRRRRRRRRHLVGFGSWRSRAHALAGSPATRRGRQPRRPSPGTARRAPSPSTERGLGRQSAVMPATPSRRWRRSWAASSTALCRHSAAR